MLPNVKRYPIEFYGEVYTGDRELIKEREQNDFCPYRRDKTCSKTRKSDSSETIGTCIVGYPKRGESKPWCICPHRLEVESVLHGLESELTGEGEFVILEEVPLEDGKGNNVSIDYVVCIHQDGEVVDFAGVEGQAVDTAGGKVWEHREAFLDDEREMTEDAGHYGLNRKRSLRELMMQQALQKGVAFNRWDKNLIFLIQDLSLEYLRENTDTGGLNPALDEDPIHLYTYSLNFDDSESEYVWEQDEKVSTGLDSVANMMSTDEYLQENEFEDLILSRIEESDETEDDSQQGLDSFL